MKFTLSFIILYLSNPLAIVDSQGKDAYRPGLTGITANCENTDEVDTILEVITSLWSSLKTSAFVFN